MNFYPSILIPIFILISLTGIQAQDKDSIDWDFAASVTLDSFVVVAQKKGFDVGEFITMVKEDKTFYKAFKNLRTATYQMETEMTMFNTKDKEIAAYKSTIRQLSDGTCRTMEKDKEESSGKFYKRRKKPKYYTAKMHRRLFYTQGEKCEGKGNGENRPKKGMEKHVAELKKLIFNPGQKADIPFIGDKTAIFEEDMAKYYDFSVSNEMYQGQRDCYVFKAEVKDEFKTKKKKKTVIKYLETYFDKETFQVVARNYTLQHNGTAFQFDISMKIRLTQYKDKYYPIFIEYDGWWDVPAKRPEISLFTLDFENFVLD